jgi:acetyl-CoA carboxylase alpha subunit
LDADAAARNVGHALGAALDALGRFDGESLAQHRYERFRALGSVVA